MTQDQDKKDLRPLEFSAEDLEAFEHSAEDVRNGRFATDAEVRELFARFRHFGVKS